MYTYQLGAKPMKNEVVLYKVVLNSGMFSQNQGPRLTSITAIETEKSYTLPMDSGSDWGLCQAHR